MSIKVFAVTTGIIGLLASSGVIAQGLTREEVRQQLVQAEENGSRSVTNASYPDVGPTYRARIGNDGYGKPSAELSSSGARVPKPQSNNEPCVGPVSFCNIYAGS
jgi:hypothetical protein